MKHQVVIIITSNGGRLEEAASWDSLARKKRSGLFAQRQVGGLQVALAAGCRLGRGFGTPLRVLLAVLHVAHGLDVAAAAHPPAGDL